VDLKTANSNATVPLITRPAASLLGDSLRSSDGDLAPVTSSPSLEPLGRMLVLGQCIIRRGEDLKRGGPRAIQVEQ